MQKLLTLLGFYLAPIVVWLVSLGLGLIMAEKVITGTRLVVSLALGPVLMIAAIGTLWFQTFKRFGLGWSLGYLALSLLTFALALFLTLVAFNR